MANESARRIARLTEPSAAASARAAAGGVLFGVDNRYPRLVCVALAALAALGLAVVYLVDPRVQGVYPVCPFFGLTGFHCAGCGTLRALHTLMRGDVAAAVGYNAMAMMSLPFIAYSGARAAMSAFGLPSPPPAASAQSASADAAIPAAEIVSMLTPSVARITTEFAGAKPATTRVKTRL